MFMIVIYQRQKTFQLPIMSYFNVVVNIQWEINNILQDVQEWSRAYIYDIIYSGNSLSDLFQKLYILFEIFQHYNIFNKLTKSYLNYPWPIKPEIVGFVWLLKN